MPDLGDGVDLSIFSQILEMDESEEEREFSKPLVSGFFVQAEETFVKMDEALYVGPPPSRRRSPLGVVPPKPLTSPRSLAANLGELSSLGHFLKGSSATLGFNKVRDSCQVIQQYGHKLRVDGSDEPDEDVCLSRIHDAIRKVKVDLADLRTTLKTFFNDESL